MNKKITVILILFSLLFPVSVLCETIVLKSGKTIEAEILEKTDNSIKVDIGGIPITYYLDEIESIDNVIIAKGIEQEQSFQAATNNSSSSPVGIGHIREMLKHLNYPEDVWPAIERELIAFLNKIDFPRLKQEAANVKSNPELLKQFIIKLLGLIEQEGCLNAQSPHPLVKLLNAGLSKDDIFLAIEVSPISSQEKEELKQNLVACTAVSQLGSILLKLLDVNVKAATAPFHAFNCIPLDNQQLIFADFQGKVVAIVDLSQYYKLEGKYYVLKRDYRLSPQSISKINEQWQRGTRTDVLKEILNYGYFYIYISDDCSVTSAIYSNRGDSYNRQGNPAQALIESTRAIEINPNLAESYYNLGVAYNMQGNFPQALSSYAKAIEINPNFAEAYFNRGNAYSRQSNFLEAISDYTKAIEINPNLASAYYGRGVAYFYGQEDSTKAWEDVYKAESLGYKIDSKFLEELKKASGRDK